MGAGNLVARDKARQGWAWAGQQHWANDVTKLENRAKRACKWGTWGGGGDARPLFVGVERAKGQKGWDCDWDGVAGPLMGTAALGWDLGTDTFCDLLGRGPVWPKM